ncbi:calcium-binding protein [Hydrogenophilus thiooxidans]|uniref:calcium-binding protein n=1 Tax=Hydrogenophilus thiooxidans TaxID=2820326 RepID=UPI001C221BBE|nr:calcium-binding protein [Hydrogenophilus thiooxidans]
MALPLATTPEVEIVRLTKALFNAAPGNYYLSQFLTASKSIGMNGVAAELIKYLNVTNPTAAADLIVTNLGITGANGANAKAYLEGEFKAAKDVKVMGAKLVAILDTFATDLANDATWGKYAKEFNKQVENGYIFSTNAANNTRDMAALQAALNPTNPPQTGTVGVDKPTLTVNSDVINVDLTTLGAGDTFVDPSTADNDVLNITNITNVNNPLSGVRIQNVETLAIDATGATAAVFDFTAVQSNIQGVKTVTVAGNSVGGATITLANVRNSVTTIDSTKLTDGNLAVTGFVPDIGSLAPANAARTITTGGGNDFINSSNGSDTISTGAGNDLIQAGGGNDTIDGGAGNDIIVGQAGADTITTGAGADWIVLNDFDTADTITDFAWSSDQLRIDLAPAGANRVPAMTTLGVVQAFVQRGTAMGNAWAVNINTRTTANATMALPMSALFVANNLAAARTAVVAAANNTANAAGRIAFALVGTAAMSRKLVLFTLGDTMTMATTGAFIVSSRTLAVITGSPTAANSILLF